MSPLFSLSRSGAGRLRILLLSGVLAAAACDRDATLVGSGDHAPQFAPGAPIPFTVTVTDPLQQPVPRAFVRLVNESGISTDMLTDASGIATSSVPADDYCVSVRMTPPSIMVEPVIAPAQIPGTLSQEVNGPPALRTDVGPVLFTRFGQENWTATGWRNCLAQTPTRHNGSRTDLAVVLPLSARYTLPLVAPDGQSLFQITEGLVQVVGYAVTPVSIRNLAEGFLFPNDSKFLDGFLQFVSVADRPADPSELKDLVFGVAGGQPFQIEFQQSVTDPQTQRTINLTATLGAQTAGAAGSDNLLAVLVAEPLYCQQDFVTYPRLNKFISSNTGFMADANPAIVPGETDLRQPLLPNHTVVAMELVVKGGDSYGVTFREDLNASNRLVTDVTFTCDANGDCTGGPIKYSGGSGHVLFPFFRSLGNGDAKATFFLTGLTFPNSEVTWSAKTSGEGIPLASKKNASAAFQPIAKVTAASCPIQDSNDDKFFVGW